MELRKILIELANLIRREDKTGPLFLVCIRRKSVYYKDSQKFGRFTIKVTLVNE